MTDILDRKPVIEEEHGDASFDILRDSSAGHGIEQRLKMSCRKHRMAADGERSAQFPRSHAPEAPRRRNFAIPYCFENSCNSATPCEKVHIAQPILV